MPLATPDTNQTHCENCGGSVRLDQPHADRPGQWVHVYAPEWGRLMICDPAKVREATERHMEDYHPEVPC